MSGDANMANIGISRLAFAVEMVIKSLYGKYILDNYMMSKSGHIFTKAMIKLAEVTANGMHWTNADRPQHHWRMRMAVDDYM